MDARAISVVTQIKDGDNPVSLILAETLLELDALDMIAKPTTGNYEPSSFLSGAIIKIECQTESD